MNRKLAIGGSPKTDSEKLLLLVHRYSAVADSVAHTNSPTIRQNDNLNAEAFRTEADTLSKDYPILRPPLARIHLSLCELRETAAKLTAETDWSDQQMFSDTNPCQRIWMMLQKQIADFDRLANLELGR